MNTMSGAILLSTAGVIATASAIHEQMFNLGFPVWQSVAAVAILGGTGLFLIFGKRAD